MLAAGSLQRNCSIARVAPGWFPGRQAGSRLDTPPTRQQLAHVRLRVAVIDEIEHPAVSRRTNHAARGLPIGRTRRHDDAAPAAPAKAKKAATKKTASKSTATKKKTAKKEAR